MECVSVHVTAAVTENVSVFEVAPPDVTVTGYIPIAAIDVAGMLAITWLAVTDEAVNPAPLKLTVAGLVNPDPFTVSTNPAPPAIAVFGLSEVMLNAPPELCGFTACSMKSVAFWSVSVLPVVRVTEVVAPAAV